MKQHSEPHHQKKVANMLIQFTHQQIPCPTSFAIRILLCYRLYQGCRQLHWFGCHRLIDLDGQAEEHLGRGRVRQICVNTCERRLSWKRILNLGRFRTHNSWCLKYIWLLFTPPPKKKAMIFNNINPLEETKQGHFHRRYICPKEVNTYYQFQIRYIMQALKAWGQHI